MHSAEGSVEVPPHMDSGIPVSVFMIGLVAVLVLGGLALYRARRR